MREQDEAWADKRYFSEARMPELYDDKLKAAERKMEDEMAEEEVWKVARQAIDASLEIADKVGQT